MHRVAWRLGATALTVALVACTADVRPPPTAMVGRGSASPTADLEPSEPMPTPSASQGAPGPPPLNDLERTVIGALGGMGISGMRAEFPYDNANIWAQLDGRRELFVSAVPVPSDAASFVVSDRRDSNGVTIEYGEHAGLDDPAVRFTCSGTNYYVRGDIPVDYRDIDAFLDAFLLALECHSS